MSTITKVLRTERLRSLLVLVFAGCLISSTAPAASAQQRATALPLRIEQVIVQNGQLVAIGSLGTQAFRSPLTLGTQASDNPACPILDLQLGPINVDLLGLIVETSPICLMVKAEPGGGNLLGNLLCAVARLLDRGVSLDRILRTLGPQRLLRLLAGLTGLLDAALDAVLRMGAVTAQTTEDDPDCPILNLALGPIDLNLLGLDVELDDCDDGPVTVEVGAEAGAGNLLGNLLCSLVGLLDDPLALLDELIAGIEEILANLP